MNSSSNTSKNTSSKDDDVENIRDIEITTCCESSESALLLHHHHRGRQFCLSNLAASSSSSQLQIQSLDRTLACPCCGLRMPLHHDDQVAVTVNDLRGLPAGVKFDPTDVEILEHLEAKVCSDMAKIHPLIDRFIPTIKGDNGICYTHPEKLPGVSKDGQIRHFFHRPSKAYTTGTRKRRKVDSSTEEDPTGGGETRWHKTGKTRPVLVNGMLKGFKKILVLYANYGRQRKPEKTNWVMHQYHLGDQDEEKDGELVVSKVFYQTQPRQCGGQHAVAIRELPPPLQQRGDVDGSSTIVTYFHHQQQFISYHNQQHDINIPVVTSGPRDSDQSFPHELIPNNISGLQSSFISLDSACEHQQQQPKELR